MLTTVFALPAVARVALPLCRQAGRDKTFESPWPLRRKPTGFHPHGWGARPMGTHCKASSEINEGSSSGGATGSAKVLPRRPSTSNEIDSGPSAISSGTVMPSS